WMWNPSLGGLPSEEFLRSVDPLLTGIRAKLGGRYATSDQIAGYLAPSWAARLGLRAGIPIPVGAFDAHWDAIGAGVRPGDVVNVVGTSTCIIAVAEDDGYRSWTFCHRRYLRCHRAARGYQCRSAVARLGELQSWTDRTAAHE